MKRLFLLLALFGAIFTSCDKSSNDDGGGEVVYNLGDVVTVGDVKGVVFYKDDAVTKIVSVEEVQLPWSSEYVATNAIDADNGANNMAIIKEISGWEEKYVTFKWCADYGEGWYLPALNELREIYNQRLLINTTFELNGYAKLDLSSGAFYWSSTEATRIAVSGIYFDSGNSYNYMKNKTYPLRAVLAF